MSHVYTMPLVLSRSRVYREMADTTADTGAGQSEQTEQTQPNGHTTAPQQTLTVRQRVRAGRARGRDGGRREGVGRERERERARGRERVGRERERERCHQVLANTLSSIYTCTTELRYGRLECYWSLLSTHDHHCLFNCILYFYTRVSGPDHFM